MLCYVMLICDLKSHSKVGSQYLNPGRAQLSRTWVVEVILQSFLPVSKNSGFIHLLQ